MEIKAVLRLVQFLSPVGVIVIVGVAVGGAVAGVVLWLFVGLFVCRLVVGWLVPLPLAHRTCAYHIALDQWARGFALVALSQMKMP